MSANNNGLMTTKQVAGTANIFESNFFVLNTDPVSVDTLSANEVVANNIISGTIEVSDTITLDGGVLDVSGGSLRLDGVPIGGGSGSQDLSGVLTIGNSAGSSTINMNNNKITNLATPTDISDATTKLYVDTAVGGITPANWSTYPATSDIEVAGYQMNDVQFINALEINENPVFIYNPNNLGSLQVLLNALVVAGGDNRTDISNNGVGIATQKNITRGTIDTGAGETIGSFITFGKDTADNDIPYARVVGVATNPTTGTTLGRMNLGVRSGATNLVIAQLDASANEMSIQGNSTTRLNINSKKLVNVPTPVDGTDGANKAYVDSAVAGGAQSLAQVLAVGNKAGTTIDMSQNSITNVPTISNTSATLNITADDLNLSATGLTSVLNIGSTFGTLISSVGAIDITAGGLTAINSTGNISIGSLGTTSIENFNLNNSVLTKVPATSDLQLNNISKIINNSANIDLSSSSVNLNNFQFSSSTLQAPGATRLFLDDVEAVNNDAVGGRIDITASIVANNNFEFAGSTLSSGSVDFTLNNIGTLNSSTAGSTIDSKATLQASGTGLTNAVGFKTSILTASSGDSIGAYIDQTTATQAGANAVGIYVAGTEANNTSGNAVGISVQTILGGTNTGDTATGVEVWGTMTGDIKRGFYEHSASANVQNTFINRVGIGADANSNYILDVSGLSRIYTTGSNPTSLLLENQEAGPSANVLQIYKNSASPAVNDFVGNIQFAGNTTTGVKHNYATIQVAIQDPTNTSEDGEMRLRATNNGSVKDFIHIDGSNSLVAINPSASSINFAVEDNSGNNLIYADASNANVMFKNYPQRYIYDICNNYTLVLPNAFNTMRIVAFGAGGGGGSGRKGTSSCFGGGAGAGGNGVELWYDRRELLPDASGSITLYITPGSGGAGGTAVSTAATNGNNGSNGGTTYVNLNGFGAGASQRLIPDTATSGGNGGSGGTGASGTGGTAPTFSSDRNIGSQGRSGASSSITGQPARNTTALLYNGSVYSQTGGSGAGGGIDAAGTTQYAGGVFVSPTGQKYNALGANVNKGGAAGTAGGTPGGNGDIVSFDLLTTSAVRPLAGMCSLMGGGGASIGGNGGAGGGWTYGVAGSRGDGGAGGGATGNAGSVPSGAGGRGADGFVYITIW